MTPILDQPHAAGLKATRTRPHPGELAGDAVRRFVHRAIRLCRPDGIYWCNGSAYERTRLSEQAQRELNLETCTLVGQANNPAVAPRTQVESEFQDCMVGRTMYVVPFMTKPTVEWPGDLSIEITDSLPFVLNIAKQSNIGDVALRAIGANDNFSRGLHSVGNGSLQYACNSVERSR
jgi:phosphoenolpyruvate carboxykinase (GTP)